MDLTGAVALVTGGNGGLGQRICHALAKEGAHVAVMYAQSRDQAEGVARELTTSYQINAAAFACDITDGAAVDKLVGDVTKRLGRIDILVNDAAYNKAIPFTDLDNLTLEVWDKIMAVNLTGPMRLIKAVAPIMKAQGRGRIVNISSVAGLGPQGSSIAYTRYRRRASSTSRAAWPWHWRPRRWSTAWRRDCWRAPARQPISDPR
jgi:3-oxoacyl-[acyl-carrier protein] reductase